MAEDPPSLFGAVRRALRVSLDRLADRYYGIDTVTGAMTYARERSRFGDAGINGPVSHWLLRRYIAAGQVRPADVFYDLGCGHGRVLCFMARKRLAKCVGIELSSEFAARAELNARRLRRRLSPVEIRVGDAVEMNYEDGTVFFVANSFGHRTLRAVLERIQGTLQAHPRRLLFIFYIPTPPDPLVEEVIRSAAFLKFAGRRKAFYSPMQAQYWVHER